MRREQRASMHYIHEKGNAMVYIIGSGKLASSLLSGLKQLSSDTIQAWDERAGENATSCILIHAGSGRQLRECMDFCQKTNSVFVELATGSNFNYADFGFPVVICPNASILMLKTLAMLKKSGPLFQKYRKAIIESHQRTKKTIAGTSVAFAESLLFPREKIQSIREPAVQDRELHIPPEYLKSHAYHKITIQDEGCEITIETKVTGTKSYVLGTNEIIQKIKSATLENKVYDVTDFMASSW